MSIDCLDHKSMLSRKNGQRLLLAGIALLTVILLATEMSSDVRSTRGLTLSNPPQGNLSSTSSWRRLDCNGTLIERSADANPSAGHLLTELILHVTGINQSRIIRLLKQTLMKRSREAGPLLTILCDFASKYRCPPCVDSRPLPKTALDPRIRLEHEGNMNGFKLPVVTVQHSGRLGNLMSEYATIFALKKIYNGSVVLTPKFARALRVYFRSISLPVMEERVEWTSMSRDFKRKRSYQALQLAAAGLLGPKAFQFTGFLHDLTLVNAFREEVRQELAFHEGTLQKATARLQGVMAMVKLDIENEHMTVIGVHVRLTDYSNHMYKLFTLENFTEPYERYLRRAVDVFTTRHNNTVFVVTSDDIKEARNIFQRLAVRNVFVSQGSPEEDMCLLTLCDHNILTFGSYGFWTGYLGRGTTVYPRLSDTTLEYPFSKPFYEKARVKNFVPVFFR